MKFALSLIALLVTTASPIAAVPSRESNLLARQFGKGQGNQGKGQQGKGGNQQQQQQQAAAAAAAAKNNGKNNNNGKGGNNNNNAAGQGGAAAAAGGNAQTSQTLDPSVIAKGFNQNGQNPPVDGQTASLTSTNNFINFCAGKTITNGEQLKQGSCNPCPIGEIPSTQNMPSAKFVFPPNGDASLAANTQFTIKMAIQKMQTGVFVNADKNYFAAPQQLNAQGQIIGHTHVTVEQLQNAAQTTPTDPGKFAFFKGINGAAQGGVVTADVTDGLPAGAYRVCSINSSSNHQPVIVPVAQHGSLDDCSYFTVGGAGGAKNQGAGNANAAGGAAAAAAQQGKGKGGAGNANAAAGQQGKQGAGNANAAAGQQGKQGAGNANAAAGQQGKQGAGNANAAAGQQGKQGAGNAAAGQQGKQGAGNANAAGQQGAQGQQGKGQQGQGQQGQGQQGQGQQGQGQQGQGQRGKNNRRFLREY